MRVWSLEDGFQEQSSNRLQVIIVKSYGGEHWRKSQALYLAGTK